MQHRTVRDWKGGTQRTGRDARPTLLRSVRKTYFVAPFEVGVFHEGPVSNLSLKQVMNVLIDNGFNNDVKFGKIISR